MKQRRVKHKSTYLKDVLSNNKGSAMITALVVGLVIFAFCLSMLLVSYTLFSQTSRSQIQLACKNLAQSVAEEIGDELKDPASYEDDESLAYYLKNRDPEVDTLELEMSSSDSSIDNYSVFVTFEFESSKKVKADIECYRDYGNLKDVQSYTVHTEYELK